MATRRSFTLTELLVVVAIVMVLAGLILAGANAVRRSLAVAETGRRINGIVTALQAYASGRPDAPGVETLLRSMRTLIQAGSTGQPATVFPGVVRFRKDTRVGVLAPDSGEAWPETAGGRPTWMFAHPWGLKPTDFLVDPEGNDPPLRMPNPTEEAALQPDEHGLSGLTPDFSPELLVVAGELPYEGDMDAARRLYRTDRRPSAPWNDAWGNPLVIAFAWYHPRCNSTIVNRAKGYSSHAMLSTATAAESNRGDLFAQKAIERYGWYRAAYVAVAAIGESPPASIAFPELRNNAATWTGPAGIQQRIWQTVNDACNQESGQEVWRSRSGTDLVAHPPWTGVRSIRRDGSVRILSAPSEIR